MKVEFNDNARIAMKWWAVALTLCTAIVNAPGLTLVVLAAVIAALIWTLD
jgi:hypothetical protein